MAVIIISGGTSSGVIVNKTTSIKKTKTVGSTSGGVHQSTHYVWSGGKWVATSTSTTTNNNYTQPTETYVGYLQDLGIANHMTAAQVSAASKYGHANHMDSTGFEAYVSSKYTGAYVQSWRGKQDVDNFRTRWQAYFGQQPPAKSDYMNWLKEGKGTNSNQMDQYIQGTKAWQQQYVARGFGKNIAFALQQSPEQFQNYYQQYAKTMADNGVAIDNNVSKMIFGAQLDPAQLAQNFSDYQKMAPNLQAMHQQAAAVPVQAKPSIAAQQNPISTDAKNALLYGANPKNGQTVAQAKAGLANAFQLANSMDNSKINKFSSERDTKGTVTEGNTFGNLNT